jgi:hypothetical protein
MFLRRLVVLMCFTVSPLVVQAGRACMCFSAPLCSQLPAADEKRTIFVGTAVEVFPTSMDELGAMERAMFEGEREALERTKGQMLRNWGPILSSGEVRIIELANAPSDLFRVSDLSMYSRRVRFRVREELEGSAGEEFEVFTEATSCGYKFQAGREYLVVSHQNKETGRWSTGACSRSAPVESADAQQDMRALRARKAGEPMAPRIYGRVGEPLPSALLRLAGASFHREAVSDADGRFAFDNLPAGKYRLEVGGMEASGGPQEIDLSGGGCFEAEVIVELGARYVVLGAGAPRVDVGWLTWLLP